MKKGAVTAVALCPPGTAWQALGGMVSKQPWPRGAQDMLHRLGADFANPYSKWPVFLLPQQFDAACRSVELLRGMGLDPVFEYGTVSNPSSGSIHSAKWYRVLYPDRTDGFITQEMFESEWPCELPTPEVATRAHGCSLRKRQTRKLKICQRTKIKSVDFIAASTPFYSFPWQTLAVTARLRDALLDSDLRGFAFLPVAGAEAPAEDLVLERGPCPTDSTEWFQWVIEGRTKPRPVDDFISVQRADGRRDCTVCGRRTGDPQRRPLLEEGLLDGTVDVQVCEEFELPDGQRLMNVDGELVASSRFVEFCHKAKFKGLSTLTGRAPNFSAVYLGPAV